ncbi:hypothetical protein THAOC_07930 [Thalassiosira oceanica]|uniref:Uncharacterized protein n=1 Tax=Thalassiosira oceanica TaxID=159749 RepID=K0SZ79_THAOC|nr:hypothetical protein THAOC_07930 [Thalassiosira oceanica]|eukprot:EJK70690.1 hypothetical protein THAOC_07930 [Thalassiosira oceanica]
MKSTTTACAIRMTEPSLGRPWPAIVFGQQCKDKLCIVEKALVLSSKSLRQSKRHRTPWKKAQPEFLSAGTRFKTKTKTQEHKTAMARRAIGDRLENLGDTLTKYASAHARRKHQLHEHDDCAATYQLLVDDGDTTPVIALGLSVASQEADAAVETPMPLIPVGDLDDEESPPAVEQAEHDGATICSRGNVTRKMQKYGSIFLWLYGVYCLMSLMSFDNLITVAQIAALLMLVRIVSRSVANQEDVIYNFTNFLMERSAGYAALAHAWSFGCCRDVIFKALCDEGDESCLRQLHQREKVICLATLAYVLLGAVILFVRFMNEKMKSLETASEQDTRSQRDEDAGAGGEGGIGSIKQTKTTQLAVIHQEVELIRSLKCVARARLTAVQASVRVAPSIARVVGAADDLAVATSAPRLALSATSLPGTAVRVPLAPVTRIDVAVTRASLAAAAVASTLVAVRGVLAATGVARVARLEAAIAAITLAVVRVAVPAAP